MKNNIQLIILGTYSILKLDNGNGSTTELRLTNAQMEYIEGKIQAEKLYEELSKRYASETAQESIDAGREVSRLLGY